MCLKLNGVDIIHVTKEAGDMIIRLAQRLIAEDDMAEWLRQVVKLKSHVTATPRGIDL